jgi:hypothetical protein
MSLKRESVIKKLPEYKDRTKSDSPLGVVLPSESETKKVTTPTKQEYTEEEPHKVMTIDNFHVSGKRNRINLDKYLWNKTYG